MKFTLSWLKEHLETNSSLDEITNNLTEIGLEVEDIINPEKDLEDFIVGKILTSEKHPNADRLSVCKVDIGNEIKEVVCGAPNAKEGLLTIYAPLGSIIPKSKMVIQKTKIRDIVSYGMLCSGDELNIDNENEGIIELKKAKAGDKASTALGDLDPIIEIAITPNRPDCLGVYGIARDLAAKGLGRLKVTKINTLKSHAESIPVYTKSTKNNNFCNIFAGRLIEGIENKESPDWLKNRLEKIGLRSINAVVDITNFLTYDRGRPLHAYNSDLISKDIGARLAKTGEKIKALDGKEYILDEETCVIADSEKVLGIAGIIGGEEFGSEIETKNIFLESAFFDPIHIARTGRKLNINSDARYRFERGTDPNFVLEGLDIATEMILDICGGKASKTSIALHEDFKNNEINFDIKLIEKISGIRISSKDIKKILLSLGFEIDKNFKITVPSWRPDVSLPIDIVEEVIRIYGLNNVESIPLKNSEQPSKPILTNSQKNTNLIRRNLASRGLIENISYSFVSSEFSDLSPKGRKPIQLLNPISEDLSDMRASPLISLISNFRENKNRGFNDIGIYEIGPGFSGPKPGQQNSIAAGLRTGIYKSTGTERHWQGNEKADVFDVKSDVFSYFDLINISNDSYTYVIPGSNWYHPGRSANIVSGKGEILASFGEIHPKILSKLNIPSCVGFEIYLDEILKVINTQNDNKEFTFYNLQAVKRDFSFDIPMNISSSILIDAINSCKIDLIDDIKLFDQFILENSKKSL
ncbi:MAG: phenylalanine--tRNA ligase subunit beta, partial [Pseudomonadota bacterium]|nr:phenylalanine--tRNA ligase subunit beta [Pseudomonadota bacterium]